MNSTELWGRFPLWWLRAIENAMAAMKAERERNSVSAYACVKVALVLSARADKASHEAWPAQERIAEDAALSLAQVRRALKVLEAAGTVCIRRRQRASAVYTVIFECANSDHSEHAPSIASGILDFAHSDHSKMALTAQSASLSDRKCTFDYALGERQTEQTKQITFNQKRSVRAVKGKIAIDPSDGLVEAMLPHTTDGSYRTAYQEAQQALRTLGPRAEGSLIQALADPRTHAARNPIGFAIAAVRDYGGVLDRRGSRFTPEAEAS